MIMYSGRTAGTNFIREQYLVTAEERAACKDIISCAEVASLQHSSLWTLLYILQFFVL